MASSGLLSVMVHGKSIGMVLNLSDHEPVSMTLVFSFNSENIRDLIAQGFLLVAVH